MSQPRFAFRFLLVAALTLALTGCDTLGGLDFGGASSAPAATAGIDYRADDLAATIFAVDLPAGVRPRDGGTIAALDVSAPKGEKHVKATLVLADGSAVDAELPPPASGRSYVFFGFADRDKPAVRAAQAWLRNLPPESQPITAFAVTPALCAATAIDTASATYSVVPVLPGKPLLPLVTDTPIAALIPTAGAPLPACG
jgi:hypothetical protein